MTVMTNILFETFGTLDKYIGDAIVGYWGAPMDVPEHAYHGVRGAVTMVEAGPAINAEFVKEGLPEFKFGIGLNSGECSVGNMGSDRIFSYTAIGDNMNLGSRVESLCKHYGSRLLISEFTYKALGEVRRKEFKFRPADLVRVKGKENAVLLWEVLDKFHPLYSDAEAFVNSLQAFKHYQEQKFNEAIKCCDYILNKYDYDKITHHIKEYCEGFLDLPPPPDWDGVTTHKTKG
jgi:adenylate cyclase